MEIQKFQTLLIFTQIYTTLSQDNQIVLNQGTLVGLKVFPESSRTPVFTFLGIPFAEPPIGIHRFALPLPHGGWNSTLFARDVRPICPQPTNSIYDESADRSNIRSVRMAEDCLFLNIWTPEDGIRYGNLPVLVMITGEEMSFDWPQNHPTGLDIASEGVVVVTIQYRTNIFGWLSLDNTKLPGNFGIYDQQLALKWVQENIHPFGGNPKQVTLLGHGTTGAVCAMIHLTNPKSFGLYSKIIIMSGTIFATSPLDASENFVRSKTMINKLGCDSVEIQRILDCLREKSTSDIQAAFQSIFDESNFTATLGPVYQDLTSNKPNVISHPQAIITNGTYLKIPTLIGICSNEGAFIRDYWIDLARNGYSPLREYINNTIVAEIIKKYFNTDVGTTQILDTINWKFINPYPRSTSYLINSVQRLISEADFESPFYETLELLARTRQNNSNSPVNGDSSNLFVYSFQQANSMDMRGKINLFGGASHSSDLPLIMGPSLFQQISRRRFTPEEEKLCRKMRQLFTDFVKTGNPTPGRIYDAWLPYTTDRKFIKVIGDSSQKDKTASVSQFEQNLPIIDGMLKANATSIPNLNNRAPFNPYLINGNTESTRTGKSYLVNRQDYEYFTHLKKVYSFWKILLPSMSMSLADRSVNNNSTDRNGREILFLENDSIKYKHAFFSMLVFVCLLLAILGVCVYILRKNTHSLSTNL